MDREREQARVLQLVTERQTAGGAARPLCLLLSGYGGTGKTEPAFRLARALHGRYPDGVLYVDLDDRRDGAVEVADVLGELPRGLDAEWIAPVFRERAAAHAQAAGAVRGAGRRAARRRAVAAPAPGAPAGPAARPADVRAARQGHPCGGTGVGRAFLEAARRALR
ncbi:hypothetical protein [Streptomyces puniciscabiei]|uniref:hypothetical protein n=1 Tax=Streptomyces puniciscabiei TaxID=164348 RepID=UPI003795CEB5